MEHADLGPVLQWRNHPSVRKFMFNHQEISMEEHLTWFRNMAADPDRHLLIFETNDEPAGFMNLTVTDRAARVAEWGFYASPHAPAGTGSALGRAALRHAFHVLCLHKVRGDVLAFNQKSIRFHRRLGFVEEGRLRLHHFDGASFHDIVCFGLLEEEWTANEGGAH